MNHHLINNGYKTVEELIESLPDEPIYSAFIEFFDEKRETGDDFHEQIENLFLFASNIDGILAARFSWRQLILFSVGSNCLKDHILPKLRATTNTKISSKAIFETTIGPAQHRYYRIDSMGMQLSKLYYWTKNIYPGYYLNGEYKELNS